MRAIPCNIGFNFGKTPQGDPKCCEDDPRNSGRAMARITVEMQ